MNCPSRNRYKINSLLLQAIPHTGPDAHIFNWASSMPPSSTMRMPYPSLSGTGTRAWGWCLIELAKTNHKSLKRAQALDYSKMPSHCLPRPRQPEVRQKAPIYRECFCIKRRNTLKPSNISRPQRRCLTNSACLMDSPVVVKRWHLHSPCLKMEHLFQIFKKSAGYEPKIPLQKDLSELSFI